MSIDWLKDKLARDAGRCSDPILPIGLLTFDDFSTFVDAYCDDTFKLAFKVTSNAEGAEKLTVHTLCRVLTHESVSPKAATTAPLDAIMDAMEICAEDKAKAAAVRNENIKVDVSKIYSPNLSALICEETVEKAFRDMPRYAPVFSGTKGTIVILTIVAFIVAAITFIWLVPTGKGAEDAAETKAVAATPLGTLNRSLLLEVATEPVYSSESGGAFNTGGVPVIVKVTGPDLMLIDSIAVADQDGNVAPIYQCSKYEYCFIASRNDIYCVTVNGSNGASVRGYADLLDVPTLDELIISGNHFSASHNGDSVLSLLSTEEPVEAPSAGNIIEDFNGDSGTASSLPLEPIITEPAEPTEPTEPTDSPTSDEPADDAAPAEGEDTVVPIPEDIPEGVLISITEQAHNGILEHTDDPRVLLYKSKGGADCVGIDSAVLTVTDAQGRSAVYTVPIIVSNNAPVPDLSALGGILSHTPTRTGMRSARLIATDADGDPLRFELAETENCAVMLAPSGGYIARIDSGFSGDTAGFSFTVSDGLITTDPIRMNFELINNTITTALFEGNYVCYSGPNGNYLLDLPKLDIDGDPLRWSIVTELNGGVYTNEGSTVRVSEDGSEVSYCIAPTRDEAFRETIELRCTDGWLTSQTITYICNVSPNQPPSPAAGNISTTTGTQSVVCELVLAPDDCIFDSAETYAIIGIYAQYGGTVTLDEGWNALTFTFTPDGTATECSVDLIVTDLVSGKTRNIRYIINVN